MKSIHFSAHAREQCKERGAHEHEVIETITKGSREIVKKGRIICKKNFQHNAMWNNRYYSIKQVATVIAEEYDTITVITVYTFYF